MINKNIKYDEGKIGFLNHSLQRVFYQIHPTNIFHGFLHLFFTYFLNGYDQGLSLQDKEKWRHPLPYPTFPPYYCS